MATRRHYHQPVLLTPNPSPKIARHWPFAALALLLLALLGAILALNGGVFTYSLDDAYIHLAFSEQLAAGHFGLVPGELASPSSSILYPLLLVPLSGTALHQFQPLAWNIAALFACLALWRFLLARLVLEGAATLAALLALLAIVALNQIGLVFSGMEANLQIACSLAVAIGLIELLFAGRLRWWLPAALMLGPLLRYESLSVSLPALLIMAGVGRGRAAAPCLLCIAVVLGGYALYCTSIGLPPVPGSLLIKTGFDAPAMGWLDGIAGEIAAMGQSIVAGRGDLPVLAQMALLAVDLVRRHDRRERMLAGFALMVLAAQFVFGGHASLGRYDVHAWSLGLAIAAFIHRTSLRRLAGRSLWTTGALAGVVLLGLFPYTALMALATPLAANNIYAQQYQMRRLLVEFVKAPALVNDAGLTAYRNPYGIVDIQGLGSENIRRLRRDGKLDRDTVNRLTRNVVVAAFYYDWVLVRPAWWPLAALQLNGPRISVAERQVSIYVLRAEDWDRVQEALRKFKATLPPGVTLSPIAPG